LLAAHISDISFNTNSYVLGDFGVGLYDVRASLVLVGVRGLGLCMRLMTFCNKRV